MSEVFVTTVSHLQFFLAKLNREEGQDMIEYALLAALIAVACIAALLVLGPKITGIFNSISSSLSSV